MVTINFNGSPQISIVDVDVDTNLINDTFLLKYLNILQKLCCVEVAKLSLPKFLKFLNHSSFNYEYATLQLWSKYQAQRLNNNETFGFRVESTSKCSLKYKY